MILKSELDGFTEVLLQRLGPHSEDLFAGQIDQARRHGIPGNSPGTGDIAPDFALPGATGETVALRDLLRQGPVVLSFYRGGWCPYCSIQLRAYQKMLPELRDLGASLVAVSPELPDQAMSVREREALEFHVLSDGGNAVAKRYGLAFPVTGRVHEILAMVDVDLERQNGTAGGEIPVPASYLIDSDGTIVFGGADPDYRTRVEPEDLLAALRALAADKVAAGN